MYNRKKLDVLFIAHLYGLLSGIVYILMMAYVLKEFLFPRDLIGFAPHPPTIQYVIFNFIRSLSGLILVLSFLLLIKKRNSIYLLTLGFILITLCDFYYISDLIIEYGFLGFDLLSDFYLLVIILNFAMVIIGIIYSAKKRSENRGQSTFF